jgi:hypothetical protein
MMTLLEIMVLVLSVIHTNRINFPMAPIMIKEGSVATLLLMQESVDQRVGRMERLTMHDDVFSK